MTRLDGPMARAAKQAGLRLANSEVLDAMTGIEWAKARRIPPDRHVELEAYTPPGLEPTML